MDRFDCQFLMATFVNVYISSFIKQATPQKLIQQVNTFIVNLSRHYVKVSIQPKENCGSDLDRFFLWEINLLIREAPLSGRTCESRSAEVIISD